MKIVVGLGTCGIAAGAEQTYARAGGGAPATAGRASSWRRPAASACATASRWSRCATTTAARCQYGGVTQGPGRAGCSRSTSPAGAPIEDWLVLDRRRRRLRDAPTSPGRTASCCATAARSTRSRSTTTWRSAATRRCAKVLAAGDPDALINAIIESGLRGRGGAGFLTGMKWRFTRLAAGDHKYVICNADEGDPGAFMDRSVLESDPHSVLEGMAIAGFAIGADDGYIYVRAEYPKAIERLQHRHRPGRGARLPRRQHPRHRLLASTSSLKEGAGAFVCGEETALIGSIEGKRGMPRVRPPFPAAKGLWGCPTNINNVETFANVPWIVLHGAAAFNTPGHREQQGHQGLRHGRQGEARRPGRGADGHHDPARSSSTSAAASRRTGSSRPCRWAAPPAAASRPSWPDTLIDYESINKTGAIMGSGGLVVMDETTCMVDVARFFLDFTQRESCGKCTFCRVGTKRMLEILTRITEGEGQRRRHRAARAARGPGQEQLAVRARPDRAQPGADHAQVLPLGVRGAHHATGSARRTAASKLLTYDDHRGVQRLHRLRPGLPARRRSPASKKQMHVIDQSKCIQCDECYKTCKFHAIIAQLTTARREKAMALVKLEIDGKRIIADNRQTILEVARDNGIDRHPHPVPRRAARAVRLVLPVRGQGARGRAPCCPPARPRWPPAWWSRPTTPRCAARARRPSS